MAESSSELSFRRILLLAIPVIIANASLALKNLTDTWMVGKLGAEALAAIGAAGMILFALSGFGYSALSSVTTFVAQFKGADKPTECGPCLWSGLLMGLLFALVGLLLWPLAPFLFSKCYAHAPAVQELEVHYIRIALWVLFPEMINLAVAHYYIGLQKTSRVLIVSLIGLVANVIISYSLIFGGLGLAPIGFVGAAWGTVISGTLQATIWIPLVFLDSQASELGVRRGPTRARVRAMLKVGAPAGFYTLIDILSWGFLLIILVGSLGTHHLAATAIVISCMNVSFLPAEGIGSALVTLVGHAIGSGDIPGARRVTWKGLQLITMYMVGCGFAFFLLRHVIPRWYTTDLEVVKIASLCLIPMAVAQFFDASHITHIHALTGAGDTTWPAWVNLALCVGVLFLGGKAVLHFLPEFESLGVWMVALIFAASQGLAFFLRWRSHRWESLELAGT